jgi:hypothetical protein
MHNQADINPNIDFTVHVTALKCIRLSHVRPTQATTLTILNICFATIFTSLFFQNLHNIAPSSSQKVCDFFNDIGGMKTLGYGSLFICCILFSSTLSTIALKYSDEQKSRQNNIDNNKNPNNPILAKESYPSSWAECSAILSAGVGLGLLGAGYSGATSWMKIVSPATFFAIATFMLSLTNVAQTCAADKRPIIRIIHFFLFLAFVAQFAAATTLSINSFINVNNLFLVSALGLGAIGGLTAGLMSLSAGKTEARALIKYPAYKA